MSLGTSTVHNPNRCTFVWASVNHLLVPLCCIYIAQIFHWPQMVQIQISFEQISQEDAQIPQNCLALNFSWQIFSAQIFLPGLLTPCICLLTRFPAKFLPNLKKETKVLS